MEEFKDYAGLAAIAFLVVTLIVFAWRDAQRQAKAQGIVPLTTKQRVNAAKEAAKDTGTVLAGCGGCFVALIVAFLLLLVAMAILKWMWNLV